MYLKGLCFECLCSVFVFSVEILSCVNSFVAECSCMNVLNVVERNCVEKPNTQRNVLSTRSFHLFYL